MDSNRGIEANGSPRHFVVLDAIARGTKNIDKIAKMTKLSREEVELILNDLSVQRLIIKEEKKRRFFGGSKVEIKVTDTGLKMLDSKKQELRQQAEQLKQWNSNGNTEQLQSYMNSDINRSWIPFMLFSGVMDILFFTSMMSMMGMSLNPMESQMAADSGGTEGAGSADTDSNSDGSDSGNVDSGGADSGGADSGGADSGGADSGGADFGSADFGGFDGGGFGDF